MDKNRCSSAEELLRLDLEAAHRELNEKDAEIASLREQLERVCADLEWHKRENVVLEAQMEVVRLIFGGERE